MKSGLRLRQRAIIIDGYAFRRYRHLCCSRTVQKMANECLLPKSSIFKARRLNRLFSPIRIATLYNFMLDPYDFGKKYSERSP